MDAKCRLRLFLHPAQTGENQHGKRYRMAFKNVLAQRIIEC
jgi:hypothetical protein